MTETENKHFDYIILGGGSAGCTLANRLSANASNDFAAAAAAGFADITTRFFLVVDFSFELAATEDEEDDEDDDDGSLAC